MRWTRLFATFAIAPLALAQVPGISWEPSLEAGLARAKAENKPLMVSFLMMNEPANEQVMRVHFQHKDIIAESRHFICVVSCPGVHADHPDKTCPELKSIPCKVHDQVSTPARTQLLEATKVSCPQFLFLDPDGKTTLLHHVWLLGPEELRQKMILARALFDPASAPPAFRDHRDQVTRLLDQAADRNSAKRETALRSLARLDDPRIVEFFMNQTRKSVATTMRLEAVRFMRSKGNAKVLPALHRLLQEDDSQLRCNVAAALSGIAMSESVDPLLAVLAKETKDRVRCHLWRALLGCSTDLAPLTPALIQQLGLSGQLNQAAGLWASASFPPHPEVSRKILAGLGSTNELVRTAAIFAAGSQKLAEAVPKLETMRKSLKGDALKHIAWAFVLIRAGTSDENAEDPEPVILKGFPDSDLYEN
jgi:hypothetical protein